MSDASIYSGAGRMGRTRGRILGGSGAGLMYPSPFFDLASTWMPASFKSMFQWLRYYFLNNGFFNVVVSKLAEYPITKILFEAEGEVASRKWSDFFDRTLRYRLFQLEVGLDYFVYGNAFVSVRHRFVKMLRCAGCSHVTTASGSKGKWTFRDYGFHLTCPKCGHVGRAHAWDREMPSASGVRLVRWNPENITLKCHPVTREKSFHYDIPASLRNDISLGRPSIVEEIPQIFIEAVRKQLALVIPSEEIYHMARPTISGMDEGWGIPLLMPVLKDGFQMQLLRKTHEAILSEHMMPLRVLFPQPAAGTADPFVSTPLALWKEHVASELARFRWDPGYIPILPLPIGQQSVGGEGKALLLDQQIQAMAEQIVVQLGIPKEIIFGGASWSGTNVSMRSVENFFLGYLIEHEGLLHFIIKKIAYALKWPEAQGRFAPFRMAEDMQRKQLLLNMKQMQAPLSWTTLLSEFNLNAKDEAKQMEREAAEQLRAKQTVTRGETMLQNEMMGLQQQGQIAAQQQAAATAGGPAPGEPGAPDPQALPADPQQQMVATPGMAAPTGSDLFSAAVESKLRSGGGAGPGIPLTQMAEVIVQMIGNMPPAGQQQTLAQLQQDSPELYNLVLQLLDAQSASAAQPPAPSGGKGVPGVDMRPMPEQRPPRRAQLNPN